MTKSKAVWEEEKTTAKLKKKYRKEAKPSSLEKPKKVWVSVFEWAFSIVTSLIILVLSTFTISVIVCRNTKTAPLYLGYSVMEVEEGSSAALGLNVGDIVATRMVKASSLKVGDKIAFYVDVNDSSKFKTKKMTEISENAIKTEYDVPFVSLFGVHSSSVKTAAQSGCKIVLHEIDKIYVDESGHRWFKTKSSSNGANDPWTVNEDLVVGKQDESGFAIFMAHSLDTATNKPSVLVASTMLPLVFVVLIFGYILTRDIKMFVLERDVVEERRKLTDPICVKNDVGYSMNTKMKYKVLAQANIDEVPLYLSLLWQNGSAPNSIKKYYIRKRLLLSKNEKLLKLNRECSQMFKDNVDEKTITKHYLKEKEKINREYEKKQKRLAEIRKKYQKHAKTSNKEK